MYATDAEGCVRECQALLNEAKLDTAIRAGDVYGLLIEHFAQAKNYREVNSYFFYGMHNSLYECSISIGSNLM